jgi:hypothetical protein
MCDVLFGEAIGKTLGLGKSFFPNSSHSRSLKVEMLFQQPVIPSVYEVLYSQPAKILRGPFHMRELALFEPQRHLFHSKKAPPRFIKRPPKLSCLISR